MKIRFLKQMIWGVLLVILIALGLYEYSILEQEKKNIAIDEYNFSQLEKAKPILESISKDEKYFSTLFAFNEQFKMNIKPIKNCYYVSNHNGKERYIFSFKLESNKYKNMYKTEFYSYPSYSKSASKTCFGMGGNPSCYDDDKTFKYIISNPCKN